MGKLILCIGKRAEIPYYFSLTDTNVYTIEEFCYYIYHNIYIVYEEIFSKELFSWFQLELGLEQLAYKLENLTEEPHNLKDLVVTILCSADYYTEAEIKKLVKIMDEIAALPPIRRQKIKADNFLKYHRYLAAGLEYTKLLKEKDAAVFNQEEYGEIFHNIGIVKLHTASLSEAADCFKKAFVYNQKEDTLSAYLLTLIIANMESTIAEVLEEYQIKDEKISEIIVKIKEKEKEAEKTETFLQLEKLKELKEAGKMVQYYNLAEMLIEGWKKSYRESIR